MILDYAPASSNQNPYTNAVMQILSPSNAIYPLSVLW
jgi:hypothetical protein